MRKQASRGGNKRGKDKDWHCPNCKTSNFASRVQCRQCNTRKPQNIRNNNTMDIDSQNNNDNNNKSNVADIAERIEFAKNSFAAIGSGGIITNIESRQSSDGYALYVSWHVGISKGIGEALFEGDGSALLAVEILKNITFGNKKLKIKDPRKHDGRDGVYKIELSNLPLTFDDETLTRSLAKLNLENFIEGHVFFKQANFAQATDINLASASLKSLFMPFNVSDIKLHPAKYGICKAIIKVNTMKDCLNAINQLNNKKIDFGVRNGKLSVKLDLRIIIELEQEVYDILRPEIEKLMYVIRRDPSRFFGVKVFLFGVAKSASDKPRVILCGNDPEAILLARSLYNDLTKPLILKFETKSKCRLVYKYFKRKKFSNFKCCLVNVLLDMNTIKVYGLTGIREKFKKAVDELNKNIVCYDIKATPLFLRCLRQKSQQDVIRNYGKFGVYVNMDVTKKLVQVIYCKQLPEMKSDDDDDYVHVEMKNNNDDDGDDEQFEATKKAKECIEYIENLIKENENKDNDNNNDNNMEVESDKVCGICFMEIEANESFYKLKLCSCLFHSDCIGMQLLSACEPSGTRPIKCAKCNSSISLLDFQDILNSADKYKQLLLLSTHDFININPMKYKYCPTPDCKQIYFVKNNDENKKDDDNDKDDDNIFNCGECMKQYCLSCDVSYHFGLNCETYKLSKDSDKSLSVFLDKYKSDSSTQKCPSCGTITDKLKHTCNHATCVYCKAHFCWKCLWMDKKNNKDGNLVYKHMKSAHGGYYG